MYVTCFVAITFVVEAFIFQTKYCIVRMFPFQWEVKWWKNLTSLLVFDMAPCMHYQISFNESIPLMHALRKKVAILFYALASVFVITMEFSVSHSPYFPFAKDAISLQFHLNSIWKQIGFGLRTDEKQRTIVERMKNDETKTKYQLWQSK